MALLEVKKLGFSYPSGSDFRLDSVDFSAGAGEMILLFGGSGSGKSTLLRLLKPEIAPFGDKKGEVYFCGESAETLDKRKTAAEIGYVGQDPEAAPVTEDVMSELAYLPKNLGFSQQEIMRKIAEISAFFGIEKLCSKKICELSGGQKQLVNLAAVMVCEPKLLLLDEPTAQLDPYSAEQFRQHVRRIKNELSTAVIICEHSAEHIYYDCDKVVYLEKGNQLFVGTPEQTAAFLKDRVLFGGFPTAVRLSAALGNGDIATSAKAAEYVKANFGPDYEKHSESKKTAVKDMAVSCKNLYFRYEKHGADVISNLEFSAFYGEVTAVCGANGTGKSTLFRLISGLLKAQDGKLYIDGKKAASYKGNSLYRGTLAFLPQRPGDIMLGESVMEDLASDPDGVKRDIGEIYRVTDSLGLDRNLLKSHPFDLSGGELQRAALAKLLLLNPKILLLDEPEKGLDSEAKARLTKIMRNLAENGSAVIFITHNLEFTAQTADRAALLFAGGCASEQPVVEFLRSGGLFTTAAARISKGVFYDAVSGDRLIERCINGCSTGEGSDD